MFSTGPRKVLHYESESGIVHYPIWGRDQVSAFGETAAREKALAHSIFDKTVHRWSAKINKEEERYMVMAFDHYRVELQPKRQYETMVISRVIRDAALRKALVHIRINPSPVLDEAKVTLFVPLNDLAFVVEELISLFPTANSIGSNKRPTLSQSVNALLFFSCADNYLRRTFLAKPEDIIASLPQLQIQQGKRGSLRRRQTVSYIIPPPIKQQRERRNTSPPRLVSI